MRLPKEQDQPQQCAYACVRRNRFVGEHAGMTHDVRCQDFLRRNLIFRIPLPNQIGQQLSCYQTFIQLVLESFGKLETHRISF